MTKLINPGIFCPRPNSQAKLRLFCFPCAGGLPGVYAPWVKQLPPAVELSVLQLPGRGRRTLEAPITQLPQLLAQLVPAIANELTLPFAFLGHSFGGILGFEVAHELRRQFSLSPEHLFVCACAAPQVKLGRSPIHALPDGEFIEALSQRYQAIPAEITNQPEILAVFLPSLRADYTIFESYSFTPRLPLPCGITAFGGLADRAISEEELRAWSQQTSGEFRGELIPGGHFFLHQNRDEFLPRLTAKLQTIIETL